MNTVAWLKHGVKGSICPGIMGLACFGLSLYPIGSVLSGWLFVTPPSKLLILLYLWVGYLGGRFKYLIYIIFHIYTKNQHLTAFSQTSQSGSANPPPPNSGLFLA